VDETDVDRLRLLSVGAQTYRYLPMSDRVTHDVWVELPYTVRILLENIARTAPEHFEAALLRAVTRRGECELPVAVNRIMLHDTTCLPALADFAAMRDSLAELGGTPHDLQPAVPVDLTVDHSVIVESFATREAVERNLEIDFRRNGERYRFVKWAQQSLNGFGVIPPGSGIIHQVNMEALAQVVWLDHSTSPPTVHPDVLVATDSHTPMINAIGVLGWGVGGVAGQAAMLGQPVSIAFPEVVGVRVTGALRPGVNATDLALTVTAMLREVDVVDTFVEFFGDALDELGWAERGAVANMAPEYGATVAFFPYDQQTAAYLRLTGRSDEQCALVDTYLRLQGMARESGSATAVFDRIVDLDLTLIEPTVAGPSQPNERRALREVPASYRAVTGPGSPGHVAIASITSCTNTANPRLMIQAGLLARRAVERGLTPQPWVKTSLSPGSKVVEQYLDKAGLLPHLEAIGFHIAGFGCMTCIGNSGGLLDSMNVEADEGLNPVAVLSGNRNFGGRVNPRLSLAYLASPPLVIAYALSGTVLTDFSTEPVGHDTAGSPVYLRDLWPPDDEVDAIVARVVEPAMFARNTETIRTGTRHWAQMSAPGGIRFQWDPQSTYIRRPPYLQKVPQQPPGLDGTHTARLLLKFGDAVTTDHISPAGAIPPGSAAGHWLTESGVEKRDLNQYSTRRSNHEVMLRGAFTNPTLANLLVPQSDSEGGAAAYTADGTQISSVYEAAATYRVAGERMVIVAGNQYGAGSSRDWAAKAPALLGIRYIVATGFERIHRSNLVAMGVLPLEFAEPNGWADLQLSGDERFDFGSLDGLSVGDNPIAARVSGSGGDRAVRLKLPIHTSTELDYLRHGGLLPFVVRQALLQAGTEVTR
jgi:aconitate hydratase